MKKSKEKSINENHGISVYGVGPKMTLIFVPFIILLGILNIIFSPVFQLPIGSIWTMPIGIVLIIIGVFIFIKSEITLRKAFKASELVLTGFYGHMRHPMYGSFILFIIPGIVIMINSWILYFLPFIFYIIFRVFIKQEESYCLKKFGEKYTHYKKNVHAIFPKSKKYQPN
ncbi:MAG: methyltransferase family protein [Candidatus Hermodarchaeota archaeon]